AFPPSRVESVQEAKLFRVPTEFSERRLLALAGGARHPYPDPSADPADAAYPGAADLSVPPAVAGAAVAHFSTAPLAAAGAAPAPAAVPSSGISETQNSRPARQSRRRAAGRRRCAGHVALDGHYAGRRLF